MARLSSVFQTKKMPVLQRVFDNFGCGFEIKCAGIFDGNLWSVYRRCFRLKKRPVLASVFDDFFAKNIAIYGRFILNISN